MSLETAIFLEINADDVDEGVDEHKTDWTTCVRHLLEQNKKEVEDEVSVVEEEAEKRNLLCENIKTFQPWRHIASHRRGDVS